MTAIPLGWTADQEQAVQFRRSLQIGDEGGAADPPVDELAAAYAAVFSGAAGEAVLADLRRRFDLPPIFDPRYGESAIAWGFAREGQKGVVQHIETYIRRGRDQR